MGDGNVVNKVQYFNHFPKDFLRPYGPATEDGATTKEMIHKRLRTMNCEWLCRPSVAASELSDSISHNSQVLSSLQIFHRGAKYFATMDKKLEGVSKGECSHFHCSFAYLRTVFTAASTLHLTCSSSRSTHYLCYLKPLHTPSSIAIYLLSNPHKPYILNLQISNVLSLMLFVCFLLQIYQHLL